MTTGNDKKVTIGGRLKKLIPLWIVLAGVLVVALLALVMPGKTREVPPSQLAPVNVLAQEVRPVASVPDTCVLYGVVEPNRTVNVAAEVSGQVDKFGIRAREVRWQGKVALAGKTIQEGEPIEKGDVLAVLNRDILQAEYNRAKAQADYDNREFDRISQLLERNVATRSEFDSIKTKLDVSKAVLEQASQQLERTVIRAPISGILNDLIVETGEYVTPATKVAEIVDMATVKVVVQVPEKDIRYLHLSDPVEIEVLSAGGAKRTGRIIYIGELADPRTRTTRIEVSLENEDRTFRSGQIVNARLTREVLKNVVMIPLESVIPQENGRSVYVVENGKAQRRDVELGLIRGTQVQVTKGLAGGEQLIVSGYRFVSPGQAVAIRTPINGEGAAAGMGSSAARTDVPAPNGEAQR